MGAGASGRGVGFGRGAALSCGGRGLTKGEAPESTGAIGCPITRVPSAAVRASCICSAVYKQVVEAQNVCSSWLSKKEKGSKKEEQEQFQTKRNSNFQLM